MCLDQCLFFHKNNKCNNIASKEHIIQQGLAGTLSSKQIICSNCNNFFSQELDTHLVKFYEPIVKILSPLVSGKLKHKKRKNRFLSGESDRNNIEYIGGIANLAKIKCTYHQNGRLKKIIAPNSVSKEELEKIAKSKGETNGTFEEVPFTEHFSNAREIICFSITPILIRAILLDILELTHHVSITKDLPNIAKHDCLSKLRSWIRTGIPSNQFPPRDIFFSFAPISEILDTLFEPSTFSHRMVISYDYKLKVLILVAQFVNTMPWVFILENVGMHSRSVSILYKKALLDGSDELLYPNGAVLDIKKIKWYKFSTATRDACKFAKSEIIQEFQTQHARAHYEYDLRNNEYTKQKLTYYTKNCNSEISASIDAIVKLMQNRYEGSRHIENILEITKKKALEKWTNGDNQENQRVLLYRDCLKDIKNKFGYPIIFCENN